MEVKQIECPIGLNLTKTKGKEITTADTGPGCKLRPEVKPADS